MQKIFCILTLASLMLISIIASAETEFKIITLQHRFASDLLPSITPMVGAQGTATGFDNQLILRTTPERMREIEALVDKLDATRVNRKITVRSVGLIESQQNRTEATGTVKIGQIIVSNDRRALPNAGRIDIERNRSISRQNTNQFINVLDGERAFISNGQVVPFTQEWVTITKRYIQINYSTDWREITTGFAVRPRTIGQQIELEITPRIARLNNQGYIDFEQLKTTIRVSLGEWIDIGGTMQSNDEVSRKILGLRSSSNTQNNSLTIKVD